MTIYSLDHWNLADIFPDSESPEVAATFKELERLVYAVEAMRPQLTGEIEPGVFLEMIKKLDQVRYLSIKLKGYASLTFAEDTSNPAAQRRMSCFEGQVAEFVNRVLFFELWWKSLDDPSAQRLFAVSGIYRYWLATLRKLKLHTLSEPEEKIVNIKNVTGSSAIRTIYSLITNRYSYKMVLDGVEMDLTRGEIMSHWRHKDPEIRAAAYQKHYDRFAEDAAILGQIYQNLARDWYNEHVYLRKQKNSISARNMSNDLPNEVVDTLLDVARKNTGVFQRYFRLKARHLGVECLSRYDLLAPVTQSNQTYPFEEGSRFVLDSFRLFSPQFADLAERVFQEKHLDTQIRKGKSFLPFCSSVVHDRPPYININYQGRVVDVSTLQHELGHAIHAMLASHNPALTVNPSLPLAETASTFSEMLLVEYLLERETDDDVRKDLLFGQIDHNYTAIQRQAFTALFEIKAHDMVQAGATIEQMADVYLDGLRAQFGDSMDVSDEFRWEWVAYPHIFDMPFYVYAYSFGQLLVLALFQQYKMDGEAFKPGYIRMLSAGGSESPMSLLEKVGIDPRDASFWQSGYDFIDSLVDRLEALA